MPNTIDQVSDIINVISEKQTCKEWNYNDEESLNRIDCVEISKSYCEDNSCSEVITPNILLIPLKAINFVVSHPIVLSID